MPTILTHPAVPIALGVGLGAGRVSRPLLLTGVVLSILPDIDVLAFKYGIPYAAQFGHRGMTHSLFAALIVSLIVAWLLRYRGEKFSVAFAFLFAAMASHGILDALTDGGLGIAFFWPFSTERYFFSSHLIAVSPIGLSNFFTNRGLSVLLSELKWVWLPSVLLCAMLMLLPRIKRR